METERDRAVEISVSDSGIRVHGEDDDADPALLVVPPSDGLKVLLNGTRVMDLVRVKARDCISVELLSIPPRSEASIEIALDGLTATLSVRYSNGLMRRLVPHDKDWRVTVQVAESTIPCERFTLRDIELLMNQKQIRMNIDYDAITALLNAEDGGSCVCARGQAVVEGKPEHYALQVTEANQVHLIGIVPLNPVVSVLPGMLVAKRIPAAEGVPGTTVTGRPIPPKLLTKKLPSLGKGLEEREDGDVFATRSGRVVSLLGLLDVVEALELQGPVELRMGHIVFSGDVIIHGDVGDGVHIAAGGRVFVSGTVSGAHVLADNGIVVAGGVFASTLAAGTRTRALNKLDTLLLGIEEEWQSLVTAADQLTDVLQQRGMRIEVGRIAAKLLEDKFSSFTRWSQVLSGWLDVQRHEAGLLLAGYVEEAVRLLIPSRITAARTLEDWLPLQRVFNQIRDEFTTRLEDLADIEVKSAQQCTLTATGNITSTGQGFYQCEVDSGSAVSAMGQPGVIVGCRITAELKVEARVIGSQVEVPALIRVGQRAGRVRAGVIYPGCKLVCGAWPYTVESEMTNAVWPPTH